MTKANPYAGEAGVTWEGRDYVFRPSFASIATLSDDPNDLAQMFYDVQRTDTGKVGFVTAVAVLHATCEGNIDKLVGFFKDVRGRLKFVKGALPLRDVHVLGVHVLMMGMAGKPDDSAKRTASKMGSFDPCEYVAAAIKALNMQPSEAWQMTMVELQQALRFGEKPQGPVITDAMMDYYLKAVEKERSDDN